MNYRQILQAYSFLNNRLILSLNAISADSFLKVSPMVHAIGKPEDDLRC